MSAFQNLKLSQAESSRVLLGRRMTKLSGCGQSAVAKASCPRDGRLDAGAKGESAYDVPAIVVVSMFVIRAGVGLFARQFCQIKYTVAAMATTESWTCVH